MSFLQENSFAPPALRLVTVIGPSVRTKVTFEVGQTFVGLLPTALGTNEA